MKPAYRGAERGGREKLLSECLKTAKQPEEKERQDSAATWPKRKKGGKKKGGDCLGKKMSQAHSGEKEKGTGTTPVGLVLASPGTGKKEETRHHLGGGGRGGGFLSMSG